MYELIASLMVAGAGFAIELRGANLQGALSSSAPSMIVRELDNPNKLYFIKDPATYEDTLDNWLRTQDGPELGEASDRYVRELQGSCCRSRNSVVCGRLLLYWTDFVASHRLMLHHTGLRCRGQSRRRTGSSVGVVAQ